MGCYEKDMKALQPNILDDFEHRVGQLMANHGDEDGFPRIETSGVTREAIDDYLFEYQAILDSEGSLRSQQTLYGIVAVLPVIVASAIPPSSLPWRAGMPTILAAVAVGVVLAAAIKGMRVAAKRSRLRRLRQSRPAEAAYVDAVVRYGDAARR